MKMPAMLVNDRFSPLASKFASVSFAALSRFCSLWNMTMNWITSAGAAAALCSMVSFVPQTWRIVKSRDTGLISPVMYSSAVAGFALSALYGG